MELYADYYQTLQPCPVVNLTGYQQAYKLSGEVYACLNWGGPTASAKDALARGMLAIAVEKGKLAPSQPVVEAGSGTFSVALAIAARHRGHGLTLVVPNTLAPERRRYLQDLGAKLVFSSPLYGRKGALELARRTAQECGGYFIDYFSNDDNPEYHRRVTGPAILKATGGQVDTIVAGVGSGGTITGVGEYMKAWSDVRMVAVEPYESQAIGGGFIGKHRIAGLGAGFVPENYNSYVVDRIIAVSSGEAERAAAGVLRTDAVPACTSAGATLAAAQRLLEEGAARRVLCIFCGADRYE